jgi:hypothetical protein
MITYGWKSKLAQGAAGQEAVKAWLIGAGYEVTDVSGIPAYQDEDIDFLVNGYTVEVKTDLRARKNLFIEFDAMEKSSADLWVVYLPHFFGGWVLVFDKNELHAWADTYADDFDLKTVTTRVGGRSWSVTGIAVPIERLLSSLTVTTQTGVNQWQTSRNSLALPLRIA